jgi:hypothetical protein
MMLLLAAAILPRLFWDASPDTAAALREAGIREIVVPASRAGAWRGTAGITVETVDLAGMVKAGAPSVDYRATEATASRSPWIDSNGWQFLRRPRAHYVYDAKGGQAALAAAEAFCYGVDAVVRSDEAGLRPFGQMLGFLRNIGGDRMAAIADIGFVDNGSDDAGEVMNLMVRDNLLFQIVPGPESNRKPYGASDPRDADRRAPFGAHLREPRGGRAAGEVGRRYTGSPAELCRRGAPGGRGAGARFGAFSAPYPHGGGHPRGAADGLPA